MKESKASKKNKNDELVEKDKLEILFENNDQIDKKINEDLKEIKNKLNVENLSDEFKQNLQAKLDEEYNKSFSKKKAKIFDFPITVRKFAGACACLVLLCTGCIAFADDIENIILHAFGNTDRIVERAIAEGNYREIDMDYVEHEGVSIKVDYLVVEENSLYIAFNVLAEEEFDNVFFENMSIERNSKKTYTYKDGQYDLDFSIYKKSINEKNILYIYRIDFGEVVKLQEKIKINIQNLQISNEINLMNISGIWDIDI